MSDKSSHIEVHDNEDSSSYQSKHSPKNQMAQPPAENIRRRDDEPWTLPFASPIMPQFQMQPPFQQMQSFPTFNLKQDNLFEDFQDLLPQDQRRNPFRKVSGPIDMLANHDQGHAEEEIQGVQNQNMKLSQQPPQQQYPQQQMIRFPFPPMQGVPVQGQIQGQMPHQMQQLPPSITPQMAGQISQQMQPQMGGQVQVQMKNPQHQQQQYVQYSPMMPQNMQHRYPYFQHPIYPQFQFIPSQQPQMEHQHFQNISPVSKELQTKVFMIVQQVSVSSFQCNCKKSKCLKLYCECFANGQVCSQSCNCLDCKNRIDNPQERQKAIEEALIRNNDAFNQILNGKPVPSPYIHPTTQLDITLKPIIKDEKSGSVNTAKGQLSNRARKGCNCKKSNCKKKYCECFSANQSCSDLCKCESCYNRKDGKPDRQGDDPNYKIKEEVEEEAKEKEVDSGKKSARSKKIKKEDDDKLGTFASNARRLPA